MAAVDIRPPVAHHDRPVAAFLVEMDAVETITDDLRLVDARIVKAGAEQIIHQLRQVEPLADQASLRFGFARCQRKEVSAFTQLLQCLGNPVIDFIEEHAGDFLPAWVQRIIKRGRGVRFAVQPHRFVRNIRQTVLCERFTQRRPHEGAQLLIGGHRLAQLLVRADGG